MPALWMTPAYPERAASDRLPVEGGMPRVKVGVQLQPQHCSMEQLRAAWREADRRRFDSIWTWDHFFPLRGDENGAHFEGWSLLAAMACDTSRAQLGILVTCYAYRNPDLLADMARTIDHISGGRVILGVGSGWFERDFVEYGYRFGTAGERLASLEEGLPRIKQRLARLRPPPLGDLPLLIGGGGEKVTLRLVAEHADMWNTGGDPATVRHKNEVLDRWCTEAGRDPKGIERTVFVRDPHHADIEGLVAAGAEHLILALPAPFAFESLEPLLP
jgi:probable F420-dependent oxidoreductase